MSFKTVFVVLDEGDSARKRLDIACGLSEDNAPCS